MKAVKNGKGQNKKWNPINSAAMSDEVLYSIIGGSLLIIAYFINKFISKIDRVDANVNKLLTVSGITDQKLKDVEADLKQLQSNQLENLEKWVILHKDYNLHSLKNRP